jgi:hypothetical protein
MIDIIKARAAFAKKLATDIPSATRAYLEALDAKCVRMLRCEDAPEGEAANLDRLLDEAAAA